MTWISIAVDGVRYDHAAAPRTQLVSYSRKALGKVGTVDGHGPLSQAEERRAHAT